MKSQLLVVDDNEGNRDMLSHRLIRKGYDVETAENQMRWRWSKRGSSTSFFSTS